MTTLTINRTHVGFGWRLAPPALFQPYDRPPLIERTAATPASGGQVVVNPGFAEGLAETFVRMAVLCNEPECDEEGPLRPSRHSIQRTTDLLLGAYRLLAAAEVARFPSGCVTSDGGGGIRVEWRDDTRSVHLVIGSDAGGYVYYGDASDYGVEPATAERLAKWLRTLRAASKAS